jgi:hypothetical protein
MNTELPMNESVKATLGGIVFFGCLGAITWLVDPPPGETWQYKVRWISIAMIVLPLIVLIWATMRKDKAPDFLGKLTKRYFERDGFCFAVVPEAKDCRCWLTAYFQNRYEKPCRATIVLTSSSFIFKSNQQTKTMALGVACEGGGFGKISTPWPVPVESQGKEASMDVTASVEYVGGRGKLLRYRDGLRVGAAKTDFWREGLIVLGALTGSIVLSKPARMKIRLLQNVTSDATEPFAAKIEMLWKYGVQSENNERQARITGSLLS